MRRLLNSAAEGPWVWSVSEEMIDGFTVLVNLFNRIVCGCSKTKTGWISSLCLFRPAHFQNMMFAWLQKALDGDPSKVTVNKQLIYCGECDLYMYMRCLCICFIL